MFFFFFFFTNFRGSKWQKSSLLISKTEPLSKVQHQHLVDLVKILEQLSPDDRFEIPMGELYKRAEEEEIQLSKKKILKFVKENLYKLVPTFSNIVIEKRSKGFVIKGACWGSPSDLEGTQN